MVQQTKTKIVTLKSKLSRKTLILTGCALGLIIAGGLAASKEEELEVSETIEDPDTVED